MTEAATATRTWQESERVAVWMAARRDQAEANGLPVPTMGAVKSAEQRASEHVDYGKMWAYGVAAAMRRPDAV